MNTAGFCVVVLFCIVISKAVAVSLFRLPFDLNRKKYKGWLVVEAEQDPVKANPFEYAKIGFNYLSKTAKECGLEIIN